MPLMYREADLNSLPIVLNHKCTHVSIGDLHGNALKLIHILIEENVLKLADENSYYKLRDIYNISVSKLTKDNLAEFKQIIEGATVDTERAVTLIGDELADRGNNDYFTLLVLKKLHNSNLDIEIMISNHSVEFIHDYERKDFTGVADFENTQYRSLFNMVYILSKGLITDTEVREMVNKYYKPMVKAIGYSVSPEGQVTLFSHAPIGLETIEALARKCGISYKDATRKDLFSTIDVLNEYVFNSFKGRTLAKSLIKQEKWFDPDGSVPKDNISRNSPFARLVWNRALGNELITKTSSGIEIKFVHGHIGDGEVKKNDTDSLKDSHENLDTSLGKALELSKTSGTVKHVTRVSPDLLKKDITNKWLDTVDNGNLLKINTLLKDLNERGYTQENSRILAIIKRINTELLKENVSFQAFANMNTELIERAKELELFLLFDDHLKDIKAKGEELKFNGHEKASQSASNLFKQIDANKKKWIKGEMSLEEFKSKGVELITTANQGELRKHRGDFALLFNGILMVLDKIGLASLVKSTDSVKRVSQLKKSLIKIKDNSTSSPIENEKTGIEANRFNGF